MIQNQEIPRIKKVKLSHLKIGQQAKVTAINIVDKKLKNHLLEMGLTRGIVVEIKKVAPMGDPVNLFFRGYELSLRKSVLEQIEVEVL